MTLATILRRSNAANVRRQEKGRERKAQLLTSCRALMASGNFCPSTEEIAGAQRQHVLNHFGSVAGIYEHALDDDTARAIARRIMRRNCDELLSLSDMHCLARAAVFGRVSS
jgi:hypothetical protein